MGGKRNSFNPSNPDRGRSIGSTPSEDQTPAEIAISGNTLGRNTKTLEDLVVKAIGQAIYGGDFSTSSNAMSKLRSATQQKNSIGGILKNFNEFWDKIQKPFTEAVEKKFPALYKATTQLADDIHNMKKSGFPIKPFDKKKDKDDDDDDKEENKQLSVVLGGDNPAEVFSAIRDMKGAEPEIKTLADLFLKFSEPEQGGNKIESVASAIKGLKGTNKEFDLITELLNTFIDTGKESSNLEKVKNSITGLFSGLAKGNGDTKNLVGATDNIGRSAAMMVAVGEASPEIEKGTKASKKLSEDVAGVQDSMSKVENAKTEKARMSLEGVAKLVAVAALILIGGAFIVLYHPEIIQGAIGFTAILSVFIAAVLLAVILPWRAQGQKAVGDLRSVAIFIAVSAAVLLVGAAIIAYNSHLIGAAFKFTAILSIFIFAVTLAVVIPWRKAGQRSMDDLRSVAIFVAASAAVMLIGAYFITIRPELAMGSLKFTGLLALFVLGLSIAMLPMAAFGRYMEHLRQFGITVAICATVMLIGAFFIVLQPSLAIGAIAFTILLGMFVLAMSLAMLPMAAFGKYMEHLRQFGITVAICATVMLIGAFFIVIQPALAIGAIAFTILLGLFVLTMNLAMIPMAVFGKYMEHLRQFALAVTVCALVMLIGAYFIIKMPILAIGAIAFTILLGMFVLAMNLAMIPMAVFGKYMGNLKWFTIAVITSAAVMLIGAYFIIKNPLLIIGAIAFTLLLFMFVMLLNLAMLPMALTGILARKNLLWFSLAVAACGVVMLGGAWFLMKYPKLTFWAMGFTGLLFSFVLALNMAMLPMSITGILAQKNLKWFSLAVLASGAVMLAGGGILMKFPSLTLWCLVFAVELGAFISVLIFALTGELVGIAKSAMQGGGGGIMGRLKSMFGKAGIKGVVSGTKDYLMKLLRAYMNAKLIQSLTIKTGLILMVGGFLFMKYPMLAAWVLAFAAILLGFISGFLLVVRLVNREEKDIKRCVPILGMLQLCLITMTACVGAMAYILKITSPEELAKGCAIVCGVFLALGLMCWGLGAVAGLAEVGAGVLVTIAAAFAIASASVLAIAYAMKILQEIQPINANILKANVNCILEVVKALMPIANPIVMIMLAAASASVMALALCVSKIAEAIAEASSLQIPIYTGTKKTGFRQLQESDFNKAAINTKLIISTLGKAIIDLYKENPEIFSYTNGGWGKNTKFEVVVKSCEELAKMISKISKAVKDYADLKIPIYSGTKVTGYERLTNRDFKNAANNVKLIILTLCNAIMDIYDRNPEMFVATDMLSSFLGTSPSKTPMGIVIGTASMLGKVISSVAKGVAAMAELKIVEEWDKEGKPKVTKPMTNKQIVMAGVNAKNIVMTMLTAMMDLYEKNPELFKDTSFFSTSGGSTPVSKVVKVALKVGKILSTVAAGVQEMGNLNIVDEWDKEGKPIKRHPMTNKEIIMAGENVKTITMSLINALVDLYEKHPLVFEGSGNILKTPAGKVMDIALKVGKVMSIVAAGVQAMGKLTIPTEWNKDGKPVNFEVMTDKDIVQAGQNTKEIVMTIISSLIELATENSEIFGQDMPLRLTPMGKVTDVALKVGNIISTIAKGVMNMGNLLVPTEWDKDGKAIKYKQMSNRDIENAGDNTKYIIMAIIGALADLYNEPQNKELFDGSNLANTPIGKVIDVANKVGGLITSVAKGVMDMGNLLIPNKWDKDGKPISYKQMTDRDIAAAGSNTQSIIMSMITALSQLYKEHIDIFDADTFEQTQAYKVIEMSTKIGGIISAIAQGVLSMASGTIPKKWDKEGKPIDFDTLNQTHFDLAKTNIESIITSITNGLMAIYDDNPEWFDNGGFLGLGGTPFAKVMELSLNIGQIISAISSAVGNMASLQIPIEWDKENGQPIKFRTLNQQDFDLAKTNIATIISTTGEGIMAMYDKHSDWFGGKGNKSVKDLIFGFFTDTPFEKVLNVSFKLGELIKLVSESVGNIAKLQIAEEWNPETGEPIKFRTLEQKDFDLAKDNIGKVITTVGQALIDFAKKNPEWFGRGSIKNAITEYFFGTPFEKVLTFSFKVAEIISAVSDGIIKLSSGLIPNDWDDETGVATSYTPITDAHFKLASDNIGKVISTVGQALIDFARKNPDWFAGGFTGKIIEFFVGTPFEKVIAFTHNISEIIKNVADGVVALSIAQYATKWDPETGTPIEYGHIEEKHFTLAAENVGKVISTVGQALIDFERANPSWFGGGFTGSIIEFFKGTPFEKVITFSLSISEIVKNVAEGIKVFAGAGVPNYNERGEQIGFTPITGKEIGVAKIAIKNIITAVGEALLEVAKDPNFKDLDEIKPMVEQIGAIMAIISNHAILVGQIGKGVFEQTDKSGKVIRTMTFDPLTDFTRGAQNIKSVMVTVSNGIADAHAIIMAKAGKYNIFKPEGQKAIASMLNNITNVIRMVGDNALILIGIASNKFPVIDSNGKIVSEVSVPENAWANAASNISEILTAISNGVATALANAKNIDVERVKTLTKCIDIVISELSPKIAEVKQLGSADLKKNMIPVITEMYDILTALKSLDTLVGEDAPILPNILANNYNLGNLTPAANVKSGFNTFINSTTALIKVAEQARNIDLKKVFDDVNYALKSTSETLQGFYIPDNFGKQVNDVYKFINVINTIKIKNADALTAMLKELNKLGVNMGNMDKLVNAITENLSKALTGLKKSIEEINRTMIEDAKRKEQHKKEIKNSVQQITTLMDKEFTVIVKADNSNKTQANTTNQKTNNDVRTSTPSQPND